MWRDYNGLVDHSRGSCARVGDTPSNLGLRWQLDKTNVSASGLGWMNTRCRERVGRRCMITEALSLKCVLPLLAPSVSASSETVPFVPLPGLETGRSR